MPILFARWKLDSARFLSLLRRIGCVLILSPRPASLAPRIRLPKQPSHLSTRSGSHFCVLKPWQSTSVHSMEAVTATGCLVASPDALQRSARCPPQRVPSSGGAVGTSDGSKRSVKTIVTVWTCHGARAWPRVPKALQPLSLHSAPALGSVAKGPEQDASKSRTFLCIPASPRPPRWRGTSPPYRSKRCCLWRICSLKLLSTVLCWGIYCGRRRHWDRAPRLAEGENQKCLKPPTRYSSQLC